MLRPSLRRTFLGSVCAVLFFASVLIFPSTAAAAPELEVSVGFGGSHRSGTDLLVRVDVVADRLIDGELRIVRNDQAPVTVVLPVEVAGGARKRFVAAVPSVSTQANGVQIQLIEDGEVVASETARPNNEVDDEFVGVLPSLQPDMPARATLVVPLGDAMLYSIDDSLLSVGPGAVDALNTIIASADDLSQLSEPALTSLRTWTQSGGVLVIDEAPGPVSGFGVSSAVTPTKFGKGTIVATNSAFAQGQWDGVLAPTRFPVDLNGMGGMVGEITGEVVWFGGPLANSLATDAGFGLPSLRLVLPLMGLYVVVIGPLAWLLLRRSNRSSMLWVVLPGLALLFTGVVWIGGTVLRSSTTDAHGTVIEISDGNATARSIMLRSSRSGGTVGIDLPAAWSPVETADLNFGPIGNSSSAILPGLETTRIEATLDAGEFALLGAGGPTSGFDDALLVTADSSINGQVVGTITNQLDVPLEQVAVFAAFQGINAGTIGAGETIEYTLDGPERNPRLGEPVEMAVWGNAINGGQFGPFGNGPAEDSAVNIELWANYVNANIGAVRPHGSITVVGWTDALAAPLDPSITDGRTAVVSRSPITGSGDTLTDAAGGRTMLRSGQSFEDNFERFGPGFSVTWRFDAPAAFLPDGLALQLPRGLGSIKLWNGQDWVVVEQPQSGLWALPDGAFVDGSLYLETVVNFEEATSLGNKLSLQSAGASDELSVDLLTAPSAP